MNYVVLDIESTGLDAFTSELLCVGIGERVYPPEEGLAMAKRLMTLPGAVLVAHTNFDLRYLMLKGARLGKSVHFHDSKVMAWMLDGTQPLDLESLTKRYCGYTPKKVLRQVAKRAMFQSDTVGLVPIEEAPWDELAAYNRSDLQAEADLYEALKRELIRADLWHHFLVEEAPFSRLLVEMEVAGMPFDREAAASLRDENLETMRRQEAELVSQTGAPNFNLRSGDQVARFLYTDIWEQDVRFEIPRLVKISPEEKLKIVQRLAPERVAVDRVGREYAYGKMLLDGMGLKPPKRGKTQKTPRPSVSAKTLAVLYGDNPWIAQYVEWKKLDKLDGYLRDWIEREHGGRLHGRFDQSGTATGRLAAREPNLQQVATDGPVRGLFRGDLIVGDYSGLEVRLSAHFSGDPVMLDIFRSGKDLYGTLAARAWGGEPGKENPGRGLFKVVMLGSQYGAKGETLAGVMALGGIQGITPEKADALLADLKRTLPRLFEWREEVIAKARVDGFVTTLAGRRRKLADLNSAAWEKRFAAERQAVNSMVQGSAADVVRRAMLAIRDAVDLEVARLVLQVHDELILERGPAWSDDVFPRIVELAETAHGFELECPLGFEAVVAQSWGDKEGSTGQVHAGAYAHLNTQEVSK